MIQRATIKFRRNFDDRRNLYVLDMKSNQFDAILGQPFLRSRNPKIDWVKRTMELQKLHNKGDEIAYQDCSLQALQSDLSYAVIPDRPLRKYDEVYQTKLAAVLNILGSDDGKRAFTPSESQQIEEVRTLRNMTSRCYALH